MPSLKQLNEAIASYRGDHPEALITVVVDATFGHRIDPKEAAQFEKAIETNEFVAPPAGAVGRGDGFILSIADKVNATILSNDSYQEFHGEYGWLFDDGRLVGGKPVPHVGWVFVNRSPVRGPTSRRSVKEQRVVDKSPGRGRGQKRSGEASAAVIGAATADAPMPIPKSAPPGAVMPGLKAAKPSLQKAPDSKHGETKTVNDFLAFVSFVEHFPVGTAVTAVVESYSSHGAYVAIGDVKGYVPLRLMGDPAPRSAREAMSLGETVTLVVSSFGAARRSIDLAVPSMAPTPAAPPKQRKPTADKAVRKAAAAVAGSAPETPAAGHADPPALKPAATKKVAAKKRAGGANKTEPQTTTETKQSDPPAVRAPAAKKAGDARRGRKTAPESPATVTAADADRVADQVADAWTAEEAGPVKDKAGRGRRKPAPDAAQSPIEPVAAPIEPVAAPIERIKKSSSRRRSASPQGS